MEASRGLGNGDNCSDALRFPGSSLHDAPVFSAPRPPPPKKVLRKDLVVGRIMAPQRCPCPIPGTCAYVGSVMWQGEIKIADEIKVANQLIL